MKKKIFPVFLSSAILLSSVLGTALDSFAAKKTQIKCAIVAPKGSTWMNILEDWNKDLKSRTNGSLSFKFYPSGMMGDEKTVLRKMRSRQLDAGAFTGVGLGEIVSEVRLLELPFMFDSANQVDYVLDKMDDYYNKEFEKKGYVNLGWAETGFVYIFTNKPIKKLNDMQGVKMWMWEGDKMVEEVFKTLNLVPTPLALPDVLTSLQTKLIDGVYGPPVGTIALQWSTKVKYMIEQHFGYATGALLMAKGSYDKLDASDKKALEDTSKIYSKKLISFIRKDNEDAKGSLKKSGIVFTTPEAAAVSTMKQKANQVADKLVGKLYSKAMLDRVRSLKQQAK